MLAIPRQSVPRQAVPSLPWKIAPSHSQRVCSPRQAVPKLPQQIALFLWQRVRSPRQATPRFPKLPREDNTLSPTESELSQASSPSSPEEGTLQVESFSPPQAVRCSARLRVRQPGTFPREISKLSHGDSTVPQRVLPQDNPSQEARSSPCRHNTPGGFFPFGGTQPKVGN